jgi:MoxR-like ATPase
LFKLTVDYPSEDEERDIVRRHGHRSAMPKISDFDVHPVVGMDHLAYARALCAQIQLTDSLVEYIVEIIRATRQHRSIDTGASPRAATMMAAASRAYAAACGRDFVIPDDVKRLALPLLRHRILMTAESDIEGITSDHALRDVVDQTPVPR